MDRQKGEHKPAFQRKDFILMCEAQTFQRQTLEGGIQQHRRKGHLVGEAGQMGGDQEGSQVPQRLCFILPMVGSW